MKTRKNEKDQATDTVEWVSASDVSRAVDMYTKSIAQARHMRADYKIGSWCLDQNRNQVKGCSCVFDLRGKTRNVKQMRGLEYATVCSEIASWFSAAKELEGRLVRRELSHARFERAFHRSTTLKYHPQGSPTKMVDLLILPTAQIIGDSDDEENYLPENNSLSVACFCLNSLLGVWKVILGIKNSDLREWREKNYQSILYQGGRNRIDTCTQKKRQKLFYARIGDVLAAKPEQMSIRLKKAAECYQKTNNLVSDADAVRIWKKKNASNWTSWKLSSIHIMVANSFFNFSESTKRLVAVHGMRISRVSDKTVRTLLDVMNGLWPTNTGLRPYWKRVTQDKALLYTTLPHAHNVLSGLERLFNPKLGGYRATGLMSAMMVHRKGDIEQADNDIKQVILDLLNEGREATSRRLEKVAYQPSFLVSAVHKPQHPHFDYRGGDYKNKNYWIGFLPITDYGQFLQVWKYEKNIQETQKGEIIFIPKGQIVLMKGNTLHGGGFRAETTSGNAGAHARLHFYIYPEEESCQIDVHGNEYMERRKNGTIHLEEYYKNSDLLGGVVEGGDWCDSMNWNFFQGECPIDPDTGVEQKVCKKRTRDE